MTKVVEINIPGILAWPSRMNGWTDRAVTLAHTELGIHAEKFEYFSTLILRPVFQERRARMLAELADTYLAHGWRVYLRGHSNGCDVICRTIRHLKHGHISGIQLIGAACDASFERNGLNHALLYGRVDAVWLHCSADDRALWLARLSHPFLNRVGNGYGSLGFSGALNVRDAIEHRVHTHWHAGYGHGDYFTTNGRLLGLMKILHQL